MKKSQIHRFQSATIAPVLLMLVGGCATHEKTDSHPFFSGGIQEPDIPIPQSFRFDKDNPESFSFIPYSDPKGVGYFRSTEGIYYGNQMVGNLVPWYETEMGVDGWTHRETRVEMGKKRLSFVKADETATIWLYRQFDTRFDQYLTFIKIKVGPTATESMTPEEVLSANPEPTMGGTLEAGSRPAAGTGQPAEAETEPTGIDEDIIRKMPSGEEKEAIPVPASTDEIDEGQAPEDGNKQVVNERTGNDNIDDPPSGEDVTPEDE